MNKKIYTGYELIKALADEEIKVGTTLLFTSFIDSTKKIEAQVDRCPEGLILYKKNSLNETLPGDWFLNSKIEVLEDNTEEIEKYKGESFEQLGYEVGKLSIAIAKGFEKAIKEMGKDLKNE